MKKLIIKNARLNDENADIHIEDGLISQIIPASERNIGEGSVKPQNNAETVCFDASGLHVIPGLHNGHTHVGMNAMRGIADDMPLMPWLETAIWPAEAKLQKEDIYWSSRFAMTEMLRNGTTFFSDMYWHRQIVLKAVTDAGLRAQLSEPVLDMADGEKIMRDRQLMMDSFKAAASDPDTVTFALAPHAIYTVSEEQLRWIAEFSRENDLPVHIHISETEGEVLQCQKDHGKRPVEYLHDIGLLHDRTQLAHCVWVNDRELDLIAESGAAAVTNPVSNAKLAVNRLFPWPEFRKRGIPVALGTDSVSSNNALNILNDAKFLSLSLKLAYNDATLFTAEEAFSMLTSDAAAIYRINSGVVKQGSLADLVFIRDDHHTNIPRFDLHSNLIYANTSQAIDTVIINGEFAMKDGQIRDEDEILDRIRHLANRLRQ